MERLFYDFKGRPLDAFEFESLIRRRKRDLHVKDTYLHRPGRVIRVSTVLLGVDYSFMQDSPPKIFETMVFEHPQGNLGGIQLRYSTVKEARLGHHLVVRSINKVLHRSRPLICHGRKP